MPFAILQKRVFVHEKFTDDRNIEMIEVSDPMGPDKMTYFIPAEWADDVSSIEFREQEAKRNDYVGESKESMKKEEKNTATVVFFNDSIANNDVDPEVTSSLGVSTIEITKDQWKDVPIIDLLRTASDAGGYNGTLWKEVQKGGLISNAPLYMYMTYKKDGQWVKGTPILDTSVTLYQANLPFEDNFGKPDIIYLMISIRDPETLPQGYKGVEPLPPQLRL